MVFLGMVPRNHASLNPGTCHRVSRLATGGQWGTSKWPSSNFRSAGLMSLLLFLEPSCLVKPRPDCWRHGPVTWRWGRGYLLAYSPTLVRRWVLLWEWATKPAGVPSGWLSQHPLPIHSTQGTWGIYCSKSWNFRVVSHTIGQQQKKHFSHLWGTLEPSTRRHHLGGNYNSHLHMSVFKKTRLSSCYHILGDMDMD